MSQIQIRFRSVLRNINLPVLIRAHGARVHIYVWIQLLRRHLKAARFQQPSQRRRRYALAQPRYHTAGNKNVFGHFLSPP